MLFSKEYVGYLAREVSKKLVASGLIETKAMPALNEKVHAALLEELALEDRINDEVRGHPRGLFRRNAEEWRQLPGNVP